MFLYGNFKKTNILLGSNKDEGNYFLFYFFPDLFQRAESIPSRPSNPISRHDFVQIFGEINPNLNEVQRAVLQHEYTNWINPHNPVENRDAVDKYVGDQHFTCPVVDWAQRYSETGNNVFMYHFTQQPSNTPWPKWAGSLQGDEIPFVFGKPLNPSYQYTRQEVDLSKRMMSFWANFANTG